MNSWPADHLWLIPAIPFAAAILILRVAKARGRVASGIAVLGQAATFIIALLAFVPTLQQPGYRVFHNLTFFILGHQAVRLAWLLVPLTGSMLLTLTFVGLWIF